jgi:hypothetical protein
VTAQIAASVFKLNGWVRFPGIKLNLGGSVKRMPAP